MQAVIGGGEPPTATVLTNNVAEFKESWRRMLPFDELFDDRVRLLEESVSQHVAEEEGELVRFGFMLVCLNTALVALGAALLSGWFG